MIKRALISVWDKTGVVELANFLMRNNVEIYSTGGTKKILLDADIMVNSVSELTNTGSLMNGRVKTLHPKVFGGILADRSKESHIDDLESIDGKLFDLVVVNFYPFVKEAVGKKLDLKDAIEYIDIGGPSMIRAAAKNFDNIVSLSNPNLYDEFIKSYSRHGDIPIELRKYFATEVFKVTSIYENEIYNFFNQSNSKISNVINISLNKIQDLRYGENPHQKSGFYLGNNRELDWEQHQGKELSYNNFSDMESAIEIATTFDKPSCAIIKHANPCGFGIGSNLLNAFERAVTTDPVSYFGGIVGFNGTVDKVLAGKLVVPFLECIIAPSFSDEALKVFLKKKNLRIISINKKFSSDSINIKSVFGGYLVQERDFFQNELSSFDIVTDRKPTESDYNAFQIGWKLVKNVKSNGIVIANDKQVLGVGAGQMSRIDSLKIAIRKLNEAGLNFKSSILASDAFFPFPDCIELAANNGISAIIQPGGSIKDKEIIAEANRMGISMVFTGVRHFYH